MENRLMNRWEDGKKEKVVKGTELSACQEVVNHLLDHIEHLKNGDKNDRRQICCIVLRQDDDKTDGKVVGAAAISCGRELRDVTVRHIKE